MKYLQVIFIIYFLIEKWKPMLYFPSNLRVLLQNVGIGVTFKIKNQPGSSLHVLDLFFHWKFLQVFLWIIPICLNIPFSSIHWHLMHYPQINYLIIIHNFCSLLCLCVHVCIVYFAFENEPARIETKGQ